MKDIEKIKSEDLAAQVQDANPANFAIEQEVAQLVGATVPQPTQPSADDARELPAQLLVFLRRALLPIRSALRTAVAAIYAHLDSRCTDYTPAGYAPFQDPSTVPPYDPMRPFVPRTLPNLLQALTAFDSRKISNGSAPSDGIPDGMSLVHLMSETNTANAVAELKDDNNAWTLTKGGTYTIFPNLAKLTIGCNRQSAGTVLVENPSVEELALPNLQEVDGGVLFTSPNDSSAHWNKLKTLSLPSLKKINYATGIYERGWINPRQGHMPLMDEWHFPVLETIASNVYLFCFYGNCDYVNKVYLDSLESATNPIQLRGYTISLQYLYVGYKNNKGTGLVQSATLGSQCAEIELKQGYGMNLNISGYNPTDKGTTFLQNFKEHIALRLTDNGSGKTLTLSQAVFSAVIEGSSPICDDIKGIIEDKGWKVQDTNNNIFPTT